MDLLYLRPPYRKKYHRGAALVYGRVPVTIILGKDRDIAGPQGVPSGIVDQYRASRQDHDEFVFPFVPMSLLQPTARQQDHVIGVGTDCTNCPCDIADLSSGTRQIKRMRIVAAVFWRDHYESDLGHLSLSIVRACGYSLALGLGATVFLCRQV